MGIMDKLLETGMVGGLAGMAAKKAGINVGDLAKNGYFGLTGLALAKKKKQEEAAKGDQGRAGPGSDIRMMSKKKGGTVKKMAAGGSASKRADGCATKGKTKGKFV